MKMAFSILALAASGACATAWAGGMWPIRKDLAVAGAALAAAGIAGLAN